MSEIDIEIRNRRLERKKKLEEEQKRLEAEEAERKAKRMAERERRKKEDELLLARFASSGSPLKNASNANLMTALAASPPPVLVTAD